MKMTALLLAVVVLAAAGQQQPPARDAALGPTIGTASVSGVVVNDETRPQPVRRAVVTLTSADLRPSRSAVTDDDGRFTIGRLPAGRFTLTVARASFITSVYGAKRPGRPGTPITVADGAAVRDLVVRLWRGAAIAGVVLDEGGAPVEGIAVAAIPARAIRPEVAPTLTNNGAVTNEQGEFRIFGLEPGTYVVAATPSTTPAATTALRAAQVDAALDALRRRAPGATVTTTGAAGATAAGDEGARPFTYAPIFFPGTATIEQASAIKLAAGEERTGLAIPLQRVATSVVAGVITRPDGSAAAGARVQLTRVVRPGAFAAATTRPIEVTAGADGSFRIPQVTPGEYRLIARGSVLPPAPPTPGIALPPGSGAGTPLWAVTTVSVSGADVTDLALMVVPGVTITGRAVFRSTASPATPPPDLTRLYAQFVPPATLALRSGSTIDSMNFQIGVLLQADGSFRITGLMPDTYVFRFYGPSLTSAWSPRSAILGERDFFDTPVEVTADMHGASVAVTFTDTRAELSGTLQTPAGAAVSDVFVIAYSADRRTWVSGSRRVQAVRPDVAGRFTFPDLPPGEYLLGAVTDAEQDEWFDSGFLDGLVATSVKVTIADGEKKVQDLRLGGGSGAR